MAGFDEWVSEAERILATAKEQQDAAGQWQDYGRHMAWMYQGLKDSGLEQTVVLEIIARHMWLSFEWHRVHGGNKG